MERGFLHLQSHAILEGEVKRGQKLEVAFAAAAIDSVNIAGGVAIVTKRHRLVGSTHLERMASLGIQLRQGFVMMGKHLERHLAVKAFAVVTKHQVMVAGDIGKVIQMDGRPMRTTLIVLGCISLASAHALKLAMQLSPGLNSGWLSAHHQ